MRELYQVKDYLDKPPIPFLQSHPSSNSSNIASTISGFIISDKETKIMNIFDTFRVLNGGHFENVDN